MIRIAPPNSTVTENEMRDQIIQMTIRFFHDMTWEMIVFQIGEHVWHGLVVVAIGAVHLIFRR